MTTELHASVLATPPAAPIHRWRQAATAALLISLVSGCGPHGERQPSSSAQTTAEVAAPSEWFTDRAKELGLDFVHFNGMSGEQYMVEIMAPGVGLLDYDNDGDLDVYLVQGQMLGNKALEQALFPPPAASAPLKDRLYRNDVTLRSDGTRTLHFTDVTGASRLDARGYGMGVATGDIDNDGCIDVFRTGFGGNQMFHNNCDGTFTDITGNSGLGKETGWSVAAAFLDFDRDGWLDLYVGSYLRYRPDANTKCFSPSGAPNYCTPNTYLAAPGHLYRNTGGGRFVDVTAKSRVATEFGPTLGLATADFNDDGWIDIYVANDGKENQLWMNQHNGVFTNAAPLAGVALPIDGKPEASMGVDAGDVDDDGDEDLFVTELTGEGANLYVNDGTGIFEDRSLRAGLGPATVGYTGFGAGWFDLDNDGRLDLLAVNGAVQIIEALSQARDRFPLHQPNQIFRNLDGERFEEVTRQAGAVFQLSEVSRGAAFGDIDNDGDVDVLVGTNNGPPRLLINNVGHRQHWVGLRLVSQLAGHSSQLSAESRKLRTDSLRERDALGARVQVKSADNVSRWRRAHTDGGYASANDPRVVVGLGSHGEPIRARVQWPNGAIEEWGNVPADRYTTLQQGSGAAVSRAGLK